jgi:hypothetical protein
LNLRGIKEEKKSFSPDSLLMQAKI